MNQRLHPINARIAWCRRQREQACSDSEFDGWQAEENGLRDALLKSDHVDDYRLSHPEILERYVMGFEDGTALLRAVRIERLVYAATHVNPPPLVEADHTPGVET